MSGTFTVEIPRRKAAVAYRAGHVDAERKGVASVDTAVAILRILDFAAGPLSLGQVARAAGFRASKTHHHLVSLMRAELAQQDAATGLYSLGDYARRIGRPGPHKGALVPGLVEVMREFSRDTRQSAMFTQWSRRGPVVTHWSDGRRALSVVSRIGAISPLKGSPTGEIFTAWLPDEAMAQAVADGLCEGMSARQLNAVRKRVREEGAAFAAGRRNAAIAAVAAPVFDADGALAGALTAIGLRGDLDDASGSEIDRATRAAASRITQAIQKAGNRVESGMTERK